MVHITLLCTINICTVYYACKAQYITPKKGFYMLAFDCCFSYDDHDPRVWCDIRNFEVDRKVYFNNIYDCMLTKNECDLI